MKIKPGHLSAAVLILTIARAVSFGTALSVESDPSRGSDPSAVVNESVAAQRTVSLPRSVWFHEVPGRGLLIRTWVNGVGPFTFAVDTGAGATLLSQRVADEAQVNIRTGRATSIAGLSGAPVYARDASVRSLAIGDSDNYLPAKGDVMVTSGLPRDVDGVLDPTEAFYPLGYVVDIPQRELSAFDPHDMPVRMSDQPPEGTVVPWLREGRSRRPFVMLDNGDRALLDTGSSLGLAIKDSRENDGKTEAYAVRDVGGGRISTRRGTSTTIAVGSLTLRRIPTDLISGAEAGAPVLLGLSALRPFRIRFDPAHHLIEIAPSANGRRH